MKKEEIIEIIREKVIMANNQNCIDLVHALEREFCHKDCLMEVVKHFDLDDENVMNDCESLGICTKELWEENYSCSIEQYQQEECGGDPYYSIKKIIGRRLTLERVLVALKTHKDINPLISYDKNHFMSISVIKEQEISEIVTIGIMANHLFLWQPNNTLENQSEKTIKAIYDILN